MGRLPRGNPASYVSGLGIKKKINLRFVAGSWAGLRCEDLNVHIPRAGMQLSLHPSNTKTVKGRGLISV